MHWQIPSVAIALAMRRKERSVLDFTQKLDMLTRLGFRCCVCKRWSNRLVAIQGGWQCFCDAHAPDRDAESKRLSKLHEERRKAQVFWTFDERMGNR